MSGNLQKICQAIRSDKHLHIDYYASYIKSLRQGQPDKLRTAKIYVRYMANSLVPLRAKIAAIPLTPEEEMAGATNMVRIATENKLYVE